MNFITNEDNFENLGAVERERERERATLYLTWNLINCIYQNNLVNKIKQGK